MDEDDEEEDDGRRLFSEDEEDAFSDDSGSDRDAYNGSPQQQSMQQPDHHGRVIVHIDLNAFYYQCEALLDPSLRGKPVGVQQKYLLVTTSYEARARGVGKMMSLVEARRRCPELVVVNGEDLTKYREFSGKIHAVLRRFSPRVERLGMDEAFLDVTDAVAAAAAERADAAAAIATAPTFTGHVHQGRGHPCACGCRARLALGSHLAAEMRRALKEELGFDSCAGISSNKLLAKMAAGLHKPDAQTTLLSEHAAAFLAPLPARALPGCGWSTHQQLQAMGIQTVAQLRLAPLPTLAERVGAKQAKLLLGLARGVDPSPVQLATELAKQMSEEDSFRCCRTRFDAYQRLQGLVAALVERIEARRAEHRQLPTTVRLTLRRTDPPPAPAPAAAAAGAPMSSNSKQQQQPQQPQPHSYRRRESRQGPIPSPATLFGKPQAADRAAGLFRLAKALFERMIPLGAGGGFNLSLLNICVTGFQTLPSSSTATATAPAATAAHNAAGGGGGSKGGAPPALLSSPFFAAAAAAAAKQGRGGDAGGGSGGGKPSPPPSDGGKRRSGHTLTTALSGGSQDEGEEEEEGKGQGQQQRRVSAISVYSLEDDLSGEQQQEQEQGGKEEKGKGARRASGVISVYSQEEGEEEEGEDSGRLRRRSAISVYSSQEGEEEEEEEEEVVVLQPEEGNAKWGEGGGGGGGASLLRCARCDGWVRPCDADFHAAYHVQEEEEDEEEGGGGNMVVLPAPASAAAGVEEEGEDESGAAPAAAAAAMDIDDDNDDDNDGEEEMDEGTMRVLVEVNVGMEWAFFSRLPPKVRRAVVREAEAARGRC